MGIDNYARILKENRLLRNNEEIERFEKALESIVNNNNYKDIKYLCAAFDDSTDNDEVMFGLVHAVESYDSMFDLVDTMTELIKTIPEIVAYAREWVKILIKRILNDENSLRVYIDVLNDCDNSFKSLLIPLMIEIQCENPDRFKSSVDKILALIVRDA